ncbi:MAG: Rrf2 family transcriptional regulator [Kiritimatiellia bacterium]
MLNNKTRYALMAMQAIAEKTTDESPVSTAEIVSQTNISHKFLEQILFELKQYGLLTSKKGSKGGYHLSRSPDKISLGEIIRIMEGPIALVSCVSQKLGEVPCDECPDPVTCGLRVVFREVRNLTADILDSKTLLDVINIENELEQARVQSFDYQI